MLLLNYSVGNITVIKFSSRKNKAYRPNAHLFDIIMQLKYQFAIRIRFRISIKRLLVVLPVYLCTIS